MTNHNDHDHDAYDDDDGFNIDYVERNLDPGAFLLVITLGYCVFVYLFTLGLVRRKRNVDRFAAEVSSRRGKKASRRDIAKVTTLSAYVSYGNGERRSIAKREMQRSDPSKHAGTKLSAIDEEHSMQMSKQETLIAKSASNKEQGKRPGGKKIWAFGKRRKAFDDRSVLTFADYVDRRSITSGSKCSRSKHSTSTGDGDDFSIPTTIGDDTISVDDSAITRQSLGVYGYTDYTPEEEFKGFFDLLWYEEDIKQIHCLCGPWLLSSIVANICDVAIIALISNYIGRYQFEFTEAVDFGTEVRISGKIPVGVRVDSSTGSTVGLLSDGLVVAETFVLVFGFPLFPREAVGAGRSSGSIDAAVAADAARAAP